LLEHEFGRQRRRRAEFAKLGLQLGDLDFQWVGIGDGSRRIRIRIQLGILEYE
jgi:hypothetical protein